MISVHQMGEVLGKVSGCSCTQLVEFYSADNDGYSYFFAKKCTSKRGLAVFIQNCGGII